MRTKQSNTAISSSTKKVRGGGQQKNEYPSTLDNLDLIEMPTSCLLNERLPIIE